MNILILGTVFDVSILLEPFEVEAECGAVVVPGTAFELLLDGTPAVGFAAEGGTEGLREGSATLEDAFGDDGFCAFALTIELDAPIERAWEDAASCVDFSTICFCLASSLARMGTRSSGMGLFNWYKPLAI